MAESCVINNFKSIDQICSDANSNIINQCENTLNNRITDTNFFSNGNNNNNNNNSNKSSLYSTQQLNTKSLRRMNYRKYRSGSSSDSAITFENSFEEDDNNVITESGDLFDDFNIVLFNFSCVALQRKISLNSAIFKRFMTTTKRYFKLYDSDSSANKFGFLINTSEDESKDDNTALNFLEWIASELINSRSVKYWSVGCKSIKCLIRECGVPNELRQQIWLTLIRAKLDENINVEEIFECVDRNSAEKCSSNCEVLNQIELDISRTFPNHVMFAGSNNEGIIKLRRVLIGYCVYVNPEIGYCQGMNFIAAFLLIVFGGNENHSLMGFICIINHYFPPHYYDQHLTGARADQMLLKDLISVNMDNNIFTNNVIDEITCSLTLNWFLSLYHSSLPWQTRLYVMDCFLLEGVKVLFRFSLALVKIAIQSNVVTTETNCCGDLLNMIRDAGKTCYDMFELQQIAFNEVKLPKRKYMATRRAFYVKQIAIMNNSVVSSVSMSRETTSQWIRRKSNEILGISTGSFINWKIVASDDQTKCVVCRTQKNVCEFSTYSLTDSTTSIDSCSWFMKSVSLIGVSNCGQKIVCTHFSTKNIVKTKNAFRFDIIGASVNICETFFLETLDLVIILGFNGSILKYSLSDKETDKSMIANDKLSDIIAAKLDKVLMQVWVDTVCKASCMHQFYCFDANSLDVFTVIKTDCLRIYQFGIFSNQARGVNPLVVVKDNPLNGKLVKTISDLSDNDECSDRVYDSEQELYHLDCFSLSCDASLECEQLDSCSTILLENIVVVIVRNHSSIVVEYKYRNVWRKKPVLFDNISDISEIIAIKTLAVKKVNSSHLIISLAVCTSEESSLINFDLFVHR